MLTERRANRNGCFGKSYVRFGQRCCLEEVILVETDSLQQVCSLQHVLAEALEASGGAREPDWLARACVSLGTEHASPQAAARNAGMGYETFRKRFTAALGVSPGHYRMMKLIDQACALLVAGELTNQEIADRLGFTDQYHFSRKFKQIIGLTTVQFRHKLAQHG